MREARAASTLSHPNIITIHEVDGCDGIDFIAMEYVAGSALQHLIGKTGLPFEMTLGYAIQIATALSAAHAAGVVHLDLKPGNIMVTETGLVKVLDFGLAKLTQSAGDGEDNSTRTIDGNTVEGLVCGTLAYMSPEQISGKQAGEGADIFSFGALVYEMATGRPPFRRGTPVATMAAVLGEDPQPAGQVNRAVPKELERIIAACLRKEPERRMSPMEDVRVALEELKQPGARRPAGTRPDVTEENMTRILVVEDEPGIALGLEDDLTLEGYQVTVASDGETGSRRAREETFDLILLDVMLPRKDGFDVCRELRRSGVRTPVLMLTAKAQEAEKVMGLDLGADDYVTKPFSPHELRARIRALLRRGASPAPAREVYAFGGNEVDFSRGELRKNGKPVDVTALEFKLLTIFVRNRGRLLTRSQLVEDVWGNGVSVTERVVDNQILSWRKKIEPDPAHPRFLVSVRGMGYRFDTQE